MELVRSATGPAGVLVLMGSMASTVESIIFESCTFAALTMTASGMPRASTTMRGGHSCVTQFRNQEDTGGLERTRPARRMSTGGHARNRRDTEGHTVVPVRDREAPGSNPGPPTNF